MPTIGNFPLQYSGVNAVNPRNVYTYLRPPTQFDNQNFVIGDTWIHQINTGTPTQPNYTTSEVWHLVAQAVGLATWVKSDANAGILLPIHSVALGTGMDGLTSTGPGTQGQILVAQGTGADPEFTLTPSPTHGMPIVSNGTNPVYGLASVSGGGTGLDVVPQYAVLTGGITGEGPLQTVSGLGTATQVLTSNGLGLLPSWQNPSGGGGGNGGPSAVQVLTSTGTYTPTSGMASCFVEIIGGGGCGGDTAGGIGAGGGGGSGGYCRKFFLAATIGASKSVTIGAGGASGTSGSATTFGALLTANGGVHGATSPGGGGGVGGTATGGDLNVQGGSGGTAGSENGSTNYNSSGFGGANLYGAGGVGVLDSVDSAGVAGTNYGSGGSGGARATTGTHAGGAGASGICIVTEFGPYAPTPPANPVQINTIVFDTPGADTYTPSAGMFQVFVECVGGGGGGASNAFRNAAGGGGYVKQLFDAAAIGASQPLVVGAGGSAGIYNGGSNPPTPPTNGVNTTFGSGPTLMTAGGGPIGTNSTSTPTPGGTASGGFLNIPGGPGSFLGIFNTGVNAGAIGDGGGSGNGFGFGGIVRAGGPTASFSGTGYGAGASASTGTILNGAPGTPGVIIVTEYIGT